MLINGCWIDTDRKMPIENPYTGDIIGYINMATSEEVMKAVKFAKEYRSDLTAYQRSQILYNTALEIEREANEYINSICTEAGLCIKDAKKEITRACNLLKLCSEEAKRITGETIFTDVTENSKKNLAVTIREPIGLVCAITPYNRPLNQVVVKLAPAIAANNSVILKPSEKTPLTAIKFVRALINNGLPAKMITLITGDPKEISNALISNSYIDMITFTGSVEIGEHIAKNAGMIKKTFELGDSGALIVMNDADLDKAVEFARSGAFNSSGQSCRGVKRILVHEDVLDCFIEKFIEATSKLKIGDPMKPETDIGTLINEEAAKKVESRINGAVKMGAKVVYGGRRNKAQIIPTILTQVPRNAEIVMEETFGPCAPIIPIRDIDDAIKYVNCTKYGLQTGIFTESISNALYAFNHLAVGAVAINQGPQFGSPNIPFGGVKKSGFGREGVKYAINEMTTIKTLIL